MGPWQSAGKWLPDCFLVPWEASPVPSPRLVGTWEAEVPVLVSSKEPIFSASGRLNFTRPKASLPSFQKVCEAQGGNGR